MDTQLAQMRLWGRKEVAEYLGVKTDSINGYPLPEADEMIGTHRGWYPDTIIEWNKRRPGRGNWKSRD